MGHVTGEPLPFDAIQQAAGADVYDPEITDTDLVRLLSGADVAGASDADLVHLAAGWQRAMGMAASQQAVVIREQVARGGHLMNSLPDELASALGLTKDAAQDVVVRAEALGELPALDRALRSGDLDTRKIDVVLDELAALPDDASADPERPSRHELRARIVDELVAQGACWTTTQVRRWVRRRVLAADPATAARRARREIDRRCVRISWAPDSMARVTAYLSATDAMLVRVVLDAAADAHDADDPRTADQRRADTFTSTFRSIADAGVLPCGDALPAKNRVRPHIQVTVGAGTLLGLDDAPAQLAGYGPIPAELARAVAADGTWRRLLTDPSGKLLEVGTTRYRPGAVLGAWVRARDVTCTFPGCVRPALGCELDHIDRFGKPDGKGGTGRTTAANLHVACKRHHDLKSQGLWRVQRGVGPDGGGVVWTSRAGITYAIHPQPVWLDRVALLAHTHAPTREPDPYAGPPPY